MQWKCGLKWLSRCGQIRQGSEGDVNVFGHCFILLLVVHSLSIVCPLLQYPRLVFFPGWLKIWASVTCLHFQIFIVKISYFLYDCLSIFCGGLSLFLYNLSGTLCLLSNKQLPLFPCFVPRRVEGQLQQVEFEKCPSVGMNTFQPLVLSLDGGLYLFKPICKFSSKIIW